jgi:hypothetical protein
MRIHFPSLEELTTLHSVQQKLSILQDFLTNVTKKKLPVSQLNTSDARAALIGLINFLTAMDNGDPFDPQATHPIKSRQTFLGTQVPNKTKKLLFFLFSVNFFSFFLDL